MRSQLRPVLAAVLALVLPGLGHLTLRRWGRALLWHLTIVGGGVALFALYEVEPIDPLADPAAVSAAIPTDVALPVALLFALSALDAYLVGRADVAERERADAAAEAVRRRAASADGDDVPKGDRIPPNAAVTGEDGETLEVTCPHCGKETDADLDFCHWCTEPLPWGETDDR
ncbi:zinc ribbon domain-containing protein [Halorubrum sp. BOL3-1]|uniref:zinc ribbon domain-containing protein n=1 Tax=Halorubrum sp. BOL3-1 TaxID=2497325 RepID=UPI001004E87A|nr:zinc ribbon domain-containing protein [Halorubrum sp. BOL3-1]QAU12827.1 zinc ribbon domain-containing protein [Halorubrum sp. BOL3-1]